MRKNLRLGTPNLRHPATFSPNLTSLLLSPLVRWRMCLSLEGWHAAVRSEAERPSQSPRGELRPASSQRRRPTFRACVCGCEPIKASPHNVQKGDNGHAGDDACVWRGEGGCGTAYASIFPLHPETDKSIWGDAVDVSVLLEPLCSSSRHHQSVSSATLSRAGRPGEIWGTYP